MSAKIRHFQIDICDDCINLNGEACNNPYCVFCRWSMPEVGEYLDALLIRPVIGGERIEVVGHELASPVAGTGEKEK